MQYTIIIPIYNEEKTLTRLLIELKPFSYNNEILIINDGSNDNSQEILENCSFIKLINISSVRLLLNLYIFPFFSAIIVG